MGVVDAPVVAHEIRGGLVDGCAEAFGGELMRRTQTSSASRRVALVVGLLALVSGIGAGVSAADATPADGHHDSSERTVVRYGPYVAPVDPCTDRDRACAHYNLGNQFRFDVEKPCADCYITAMQVDLVREDGSRVTVRDGVPFRHLTLFNEEPGRPDATCQDGTPFPLGALFGQRFLVAGDDRQWQSLPPGYGYKIGAESSWNLVTETDWSTTVGQGFFYQVTYDWVPASTPGMREVEPVALGTEPCGFSGPAAPAGRSSHTGTWTANLSGNIVAVYGHLLDGGQAVKIRNDTTGRLVCRMRAGYGETPEYVDPDGVARLSSITTCGRRGRRVGRIAEGQQIAVTSYYDAPEETATSNLAAMAYVAPPRHGG
jgi:hypothetical protein